MTLVLTQRLPRAEGQFLLLPLSAEERCRPRQIAYTAVGELVRLQLPRGMRLEDGDLLAPQAGAPALRVLARPEPVLTVTSSQPLSLLRAAYHLGNRHTPLELTPGYLRLAPDPVLLSLLEDLGLEVISEVQPFYPDPGAYYHP